MEIVDFTHAGLLAVQRSAETGQIWLPANDGSKEHPSYKVIQGFKVGDVVTANFNGQVTTGTVTCVDPYQIAVTLDNGVTYWRKGFSSQWRKGVWIALHGWGWDIITR